MPVGKARQRARRHPAQAQRRGVAAERIVRGDRAGDQGRVLLHAVVDGLAPIAIGPAVEAAVAHGCQIVGRRLVAEAVAFVHHRPQRAGRTAPTPCRRRCAGPRQRCGPVPVARSSSPDRGTAFLGLHAVVADIAERSDAGIESCAVGRHEQAACPVAVGLEVDQLASRRGDARGARHIGKGDDPVGVADVEGARRPAPCRRAGSALQKDLARFRDAVAVMSREQGDAVRADADGARARRIVACIAWSNSVFGGPASPSPRRPARRRSAGPRSSADVQVPGEGVDLQPGRRRRTCPAPSPWPSASSAS